MKLSIKYVVAIVMGTIAIVTGYQAYWLVNIYDSLSTTLQRDIQEAVRASDFEEIVSRVTKMQDEHFGGQMDITVGANPNEEHTTLRNESKGKDEDAPKQTNLDTSLPTPNFGDALKDEHAVMDVGLSMQRGIHSGLDNLRKPDFKTFCTVLDRRLEALGICVPHLVLYLQVQGAPKEQPEAGVFGTPSSFDVTLPIDTLGRAGSCAAPADTFSILLNMNTNTYYHVMVPRTNYAVVKQMKAPLLYSVATLLTLLLTSLYIIYMIRRMKQLDDMKSDFTNNITHELKTPIAVTYAAIDSMLNFNGAENPEKARKYLTICQNQLQVLTDLVEQILSLSMDRRNMALDMADIPLLPLVEAVTASHRIKTPGVLFTIDVPAHLTVNADRMHLNNIINNLVDNAIKYSSSNPEVKIVALQAADGGVDIRVTDHGIGIPSTAQRFIFDRFYRVPQGNLHDVKGHGLGLYYVKSMMDRFGATIRVDSQLGKGTTFTLHFTL